MSSLRLGPEQGLVGHCRHRSRVRGKLSDRGPGRTHHRRPPGRQRDPSGGTTLRLRGAARTSPRPTRRPSGSCRQRWSLSRGSASGVRPTTITTIACSREIRTRTACPAARPAACTAGPPIATTASMPSRQSSRCRSRSATGVVAYASASRGFRPPEMTELYRLQRRPEHRRPRL